MPGPDVVLTKMNYLLPEALPFIAVGVWLTLRRLRADCGPAAPALLELYGCGDLTAARVLGEVREKYRERLNFELGVIRKMVTTVIASVCKNGSPERPSPHPGIGAPVVMYAGACRRESCRWFPVPGYREGCMT